MTRLHELPDGARLAYDDTGKGRPVVLLHGVCMSRRFFEHNTGPLAERFRVVNVDLRGHGESPASEGGHTVAQYAQDVKHLLDTLELDGAVLVGWSMGTFVVWDLVRQFGSAGIAGHVNVSQGPTDLSKDGWELGIFPLEELFGALAAAQSDFRAFMSHFVPELFKHEPAAEAQAALLEEILRVGANAGTCILLDQCLQDYRDQLASYEVPTLLVWGEDEKMVAAANGPWLQATQPAAELVVFEESGHCPMWEEPERFNQVVGDWIAARSGR
jgi:pimeloyl-ACP methyl ester carboxylesterase